MKQSFFYFYPVLFLLLLPGWSSAQSPYRLCPGKELGIIATGGAAVGAGVWLKDQTTLLTAAELEQLDRTQVNVFDRVAIGLHSPSAREASDYFLDGSHLLPILLLAGKPTRHHFGQIALLWGETVLVNGGLTFTSKYAFRRPRPYVYSIETNAPEKQTTNAQASFFSGHTSAAAANAFFTAKVFSDFYPESKWKPVVWATAATIPAITGYLRVRSGRHYPTDVIAGYAVGALTGFFIPHLHKNAGLKKKGVELYGGMNGALLRVSF